MTEPLGTTTIDDLARRSKEPAWITDLRRQALATHHELAWPHSSDDIWRRTDVTLLDPMRGFAPAATNLTQGIALSQAQWAQLTQPLGDEQLAVRANGSWLTEPQLVGLTITELAQAAQQRPEPIQQILASNGLTPAEEKLTSLNGAFHHDELYVDVPANTSVAQPVRLVHLVSATAQQAVFPMTLIHVGAGSTVTLIDEYISISGPTQATAGTDDPTTSLDAHLVNARIELVLEPNAQVHYVRLQRWAPTAREFVLQRATLAKGASLTMANITLGAILSKAHIVTKFLGAGASSRLYGFVFGQGKQHIDQHTLQDHQAPHTNSDLQFSAALQDQSRMIYTGLIRIAKQAQQTQAFQTNRNLLLSNTAQAETIPMLEILADDVQCKHAASVGPIDDEQAFYLMSRGIGREQAERLIVMGFVEPIIRQVPFAPLQERLRADIEGRLHIDEAFSESHA